MDDTLLYKIKSVINNDDIYISLPSKVDFFGDFLGKGKLEVLMKYGIGAAATDLVILTDGVFYNDYFVNDDKSLRGRAAGVLTRTLEGNPESCFGSGYVAIVDKKGPFQLHPTWRSFAIRPILNLSPRAFAIITRNRRKGFNGTDEVLFCEWPQYAPSISLQIKLEEEYKNGTLKKTSLFYTLDSAKANDFHRDFKPTEYDVYEYQGKKYIRVKSISSFSKKISNGITYKSGDYVWLEVSPVEWLIDDETHSLISKRALTAGIRYNDQLVADKIFEHSDMYQYLHNYLIIELLQTAKELDELFIHREIDELKHEHIVLRESNLKARTLLSSLRKKNINSKRLLKIINQSRKYGSFRNETRTIIDLIHNIKEKHHFDFDVSNFAILTNTKVEDPFLEKPSDIRSGNVRIGGTVFLYTPPDAKFTEDSGRGFAIRPVITSQIIYNELFKRSTLNKDGTRTAFFGEYPQDVPSKDMQKILNRAYKNGNITVTNDSYTIISHGKSIKLPVYLYDGKKYVLVSADLAVNDTKLSNNIKYKNGDSTWVEVKPVLWIIDEKSKSIISKKGLVGNVDNIHLNSFYKEFLIQDIIKNETFSEHKEIDVTKRELLLRSIKLVEDLQSRDISDRNIIINELKSIIELLKNVNVDTSNLERIVFGFVR